MPHCIPHTGRSPLRHLFRAMALSLLILAVACSAPGFLPQPPKPTSTKTAPPATSTPLPLPKISATETQPPAAQPTPPALVESNPPPGAELPLSMPITLYFNQAMDRPSVEGAISGQPFLSGRFSWDSDTAVSFTPDKPFDPNTNLTVSISTNARSQKGQPLLNPLTIKYRTAGYLHLVQALPSPLGQEVDPSSAVIASFNRPVVALGAGSSDLQAAFTITSTTGETPQGQGQWVNTSTYVFYPRPALAGGVAYSVRIDPALTSVDGSPLEAGSPDNFQMAPTPAPEGQPQGQEVAGNRPRGPLPLEWTFTTAYPRLAKSEPAENATQVRIDQAIHLTFNQPMQPGSVQENFSLLLESDLTQVDGKFAWDERVETLTFTPTSLLNREASYAILLHAQAKSSGGTPIGIEYKYRFSTVPELYVAGSDTSEGGTKKLNDTLTLYFSAHLPSNKDLTPYIDISPQVPNLYTYLDPDQLTLRLIGDFDPQTGYTLAVSSQLADVWGGNISRPYTLRFTTEPFEPALLMATPNNVLFLTTQDTGLEAQAVNLTELPILMGGVTWEDFITMLAPGGFDILQTYLPASAQTYSQTLNAPGNSSRNVSIRLNPEGKPLAPGLYYMRFDMPKTSYPNGPYLLVVSDIQITMKLSAEEAFLWAVDLPSNAPLSDTLLSLYSENGELLGSGKTGTDGVLRLKITGPANPYTMVYAVASAPGQKDFGVALSNWNTGLQPDDFGLSSTYQPPERKDYIYTDRPIYRPGQTVYYRLVSRQAFNGRYNLPAEDAITLALTNYMEEVMNTFELPLSAFGTAHGEFALPADILPGIYKLKTSQGQVLFQVADYRKPEINLQVAFDKEQALAGQPITATINARYFFDAPVSNASVQWWLLSTPTAFSLPGYQVGDENKDFMNVSMRTLPAPLGVGSETIAQGQGQTGPDGKLILQIPNPELVDNTPRTYTLEAMIIDETGLPVSERATMQVHPTPYYIGIRPDSYSGKVNVPLAFSVMVANWDGTPAGELRLHADFQRVVYFRTDPVFGSRSYGPVYNPEYHLAAVRNFTTDPRDGIARLEIIPTEPGIYQVSITGGKASSDLLVWIDGTGNVSWPNLPNDRLQLELDQPSFQPGDTAHVFIANPFEGDALALVSVERGLVIRYEVLTLQGSGREYYLPLTGDDAPNVYLSVLLVGRDEGGLSGFKLGYVNIPVSPTQQTLNVSLTAPDSQPGQPVRRAPGDQVTLNVHVNDLNGKPVQGEFSLSAVDSAIFALADKNAPAIVPAFYDIQPLGVHTSFSLAAYTRRTTFVPLGVGGGGSGQSFIARENFPDTAFWNAEIMTDVNGDAQVTFTLPGNVTTWQVELYGITAGSLVGQASLQVITSKDLLISPVTPRFLVAGDQVELAAVAHNNTTQEMYAQISIQVSNFTLSSPSLATQEVTIPAGGRARLAWQGSAPEPGVLDASFMAVAQVGTVQYQDSVRVSGYIPGQPGIPVLYYSSPQAFGASSVIDQEGEKLEVVSLPATFKPSGGSLHVELTPSLAGVILDGLDVLERSSDMTTEEAASRLLSNLEVYSALQSQGINSPELSARLAGALRDGMTQLMARQNPDGGWPWWQGGASDIEVTSYVLFTLAQARSSGASVHTDASQRGLAYLLAVLPAADIPVKPEEADRLAFAQFALGQAGSPDLGRLDQLYEVRDQLSPWAKALLAVALEKANPTDQRVKSLLSDVQTSAMRTASGVHWEGQPKTAGALETPLTRTAIPVYVLAQSDPASPLLPLAVRYLVASRRFSSAWNSNNTWTSSYETSWTLLALIAVMKGTGEFNGSYKFSAYLNGSPLISGQAGDPEAVSSTATEPLSSLDPLNPNNLLIRRGGGPGRLYYNVFLDLSRPVESAPALNSGLSISRQYYPDVTCTETSCSPITTAQPGKSILARVTLVVPDDAYHVMVQDYIPAGAELLDTSINTSQQLAPPESQPAPEATPLFHAPLRYDDHITWSADYLPAGTYELSYVLVTLQPGQFHVLPAHAWQAYFPDAQGTSAGTIFEIRP